MTVSNAPEASFSRTCSAVKVCPHSTSSVSTTNPQASAIWPNRWLKAPLTRLRTRDRAPFRTAASINPVADEVDIRTGLSVRNRSRSPVCSSPMSSLMAGPRCPIRARFWALSTSGWTSVGPGRKKRPNEVVLSVVLSIVDDSTK